LSRRSRSRSSVNCAASQRTFRACSRNSSMRVTTLYLHFNYQCRCRLRGCSAGMRCTTCGVLNREDVRKLCLRYPTAIDNPWVMSLRPLRKQRGLENCWCRT
jgi:hypothetical protein